MRYALLIYDDSDALARRSDEEALRVRAAVAEVLERPNVTGWLRLQGPGSATTLRPERGRTLLTDGPFLETKEYLGGFVVVEAENLDGALELAEELQQLRGAVAPIEVRPVLEEPLVGA